MKHFRSPAAFATVDWQILKDDCAERSGGRCEFCGMPLHSPIQGHHRWYPNSPDGMHNVMVVHMHCHKAIHHGGKIGRIRRGSLAHRGDPGKGDTPKWREYLNATR